MGARIESLRIPVSKPSRKRSWLLAGILVLCMAAGAASFLALRSGSDEASAPARSQFAKFVPAQAGANLTGHSEAYFTGGGSAPGSLVNNTGHSLVYFTGSGPSVAELRGVDVIGISDPVPAPAENAGNGSHKSRPKYPDCRKIHAGPC